MKKILSAVTWLHAGKQIIFSQTTDSTKKVSPPLTITGSVDGYYWYNFHNPNSYPYNSLTNFARFGNSFGLGMASLRADQSFGKVSPTIDPGFGTRADEFAYKDNKAKFSIKQLYVSFAPSSAIKFTSGNWGSHVGYEVLDAYLNRSYSMSHRFPNGSFSHTGLKADISLGDKSAIMVRIYNPTDYRTAPGASKSFISQFSSCSKDDKFKANLFCCQQTIEIQKIAPA